MSRKVAGCFTCAAVTAWASFVAPPAVAESSDDLFAVGQVDGCTFGGKVSASKDGKIGYDLRGNCTIVVGSTAANYHVLARGRWDPATKQASEQLPSCCRAK
jgi:hypothetical protein